jgi:signal transduction histidine kinase
VQRDQLAQRNRHLQTLDDEKNNLIKILAHDLRTPINHVQGLAHVFLLSNKDLPEDQKSVITQITDAAVRLNRMITHVLDIDALENDRVTVFMDDVNLTELLQKVTDSFEKQSAKKDIRIINFLQPDIRIKGDSLFLIQVFENLISNAIKFSEHGKSIDVSAQRIGGRAQVKIKDRGPGLTQEDLKNLFRKFHRLSAKPTGGEPSVGLGLSIVKRYVELMGGTVSCESHHGEGATFTVEFP